MNRAEFEMPADGARLAPVVRWRDGERRELDDWLTEEVPVALEFNGISHAVMLATPADLEDFALGFGLSEGIFASPADLYDCELDVAPQGIIVRMQVSSRSFAGLKQRRRTLAGRTGCGVCGTESLDQVLRPVPAVPASAPLQASAIARAMHEMRARQRLCQATGALHAAAWCDADGAVQWLREDVGRHNALDKLIGAIARIDSRVGTGQRDGFIAVTSRASVEMVQKAAVAGAPLLAAVSAPTLLAVETARAASMGLVGLVRGNDLVVYANADRIVLDAPEN
jgi:FdhD protein